MLISLLPETVGAGEHSIGLLDGAAVVLRALLYHFGVVVGLASGLDVLADDVNHAIVFREPVDSRRVTIAQIQAEPHRPMLWDRRRLDDDPLKHPVIEELAGLNVPVAIEPGSAAPSAELLQLALVVVVDKHVVADCGGNEPSVCLLPPTKGQNKFLLEASMVDAAGVGGSVGARAPVGLRRAEAGFDVSLFRGR